ncbi:MAG: ParB N-terminal domain-containing protein [Pseudomonadota bacterium]
MREAKLIESGADLPVAEIIVGKRLRPLSEATVATLMASIEEMGTALAPIVVRRSKKGDELIAGGHRLEAYRRMGRTTIRADVYDCSPDWARLAEIDENLAGADLSVLEMATFLAERKRVYEKVHPQSKRGAAGASARWEDASDIVSFASSIAEKRDLSERHVQRLVKIGTSLTPHTIASLQTSEVSLGFNDLKALSECTEDQQHIAVDLMLDTDAPTKPRAAVDTAVHGRARMDKPVSSPDRIAADIMERFDRAPKKAKELIVQALLEQHLELFEDDAA